MRGRLTTAHAAQRLIAFQIRKAAQNTVLISNVERISCTIIFDVIDPEWLMRWVGGVELGLEISKSQIY
jgi:hypothetical protein